MSGCGARTAAGSLEAVFESSDVERFGLRLPLPELPGEGIGGNQRRQMSGCGARTAAVLWAWNVLGCRAL